MKKRIVDIQPFIELMEIHCQEFRHSHNGLGLGIYQHLLNAIYALDVIETQEDE